VGKWLNFSKSDSLLFCAGKGLYTAALAPSLQESDLSNPHQSGLDKSSPYKTDFSNLCGRHLLMIESSICCLGTATIGAMRLEGFSLRAMAQRAQFSYPS
jgi:hypothetical protein